MTKLRYRHSLNVSRFVNTPSYELALVVHRETEAQREIELQTFNAPAPANELIALIDPYIAIMQKPWSEYAKSFDVLARCREALGGSLGDVAKRIALELQPDNFEAMFWMATWLQATDHADNLRLQMVEKDLQIQGINEKAKRDRRSGGLAKHKRMAEAKTFVLEEWGRHKDAYSGNRATFATDYLRRIRNEMDLEVALKTIQVNWLGGI